MVEQKVTIKISKALHDFLNQRGNRGETYEQIIWRFIMTKTFNEDDKKAIQEVKKNYDSFL